MVAASSRTTLQNIYEALKELQAIRNMDLLGEVTNTILSTFFGAKSWVLCLQEEGQEHYMIRFAFVDGKARRRLYNIDVKINEGILRHAADSRQLLSTEVIERDPRFVKKSDALLGEAHSVGASLIMPLLVDNDTHLVGILALYNLSNPREASAGDHLPKIVAGMFALTIEKLQTIRSIQHEALTDHLTGLFNRRALITIAEREIEECVRYNRYISFVLLDVDNFKAINDTDGHLHGDAVLVRIAEILRSSVRKLDYVIRFAGDEFVILMPDTFEDQKVEIIERVMMNFVRNKLKSSTNYSISIGSYSGPPRELNYMFTKADSDMYKQKERKKRSVAAKVSRVVS